MQRQKETKEIKYKILRDIKNLFEQEKEEISYYKPVRVRSICSKNYIECKSNSDRSKTQLDHI